MKEIFLAVFGILCFAQRGLVEETDRRVICYYESGNFLKIGKVEFSGRRSYSHDDFIFWLKTCSHIIYSHVVLTKGSHEFYYSNEFNITNNFGDVLPLKYKQEYGIKYYLSLRIDIDEDADGKPDQKYMNFLKNGATHFIEYSKIMLSHLNFDGLDLQLEIRQKKEVSYLSSIKNLWPFSRKVDTAKKNDTHKELFKEFVDTVHRAYSNDKFQLILSVSPNVHSSLYNDVISAHDKFKFVTLLAYDFISPENSPDKADYSSAIYFKDDGEDRSEDKNIHSVIRHWIDMGYPTDKINLAIPTHARAWKTPRNIDVNGLPVMSATAGPAEAGKRSLKEGFLSYNEVCDAVVANDCIEFLERKYGSYAYCRGYKNSDHGLWISYTSPDFAMEKAIYAKEMNLGGIAIVDLSYDDYTGTCTGHKSPILRSAIKRFIPKYFNKEDI